ncbi:MAG: FecR domain-containing protein [Giesbergeria sp.]
MTPIILRAVLLGACATLAVPAALAQCAGVAAGQTEQNAAAELVSLVGRGETRPSGDAAWERAVQAQKLKGGADMRTLALSSAALLLADRTQIRMSANAQLRLCDAQPERSLLELIAGRLWARTKRSPANLQLQTPAALAVVRGTDWDVEVEGSGRTTFTVLSGQVEFSNAYGRVDLGPSEQGIAVPGQAPTKRLLVNPRERVQWVMANPVDARRWAEFQGDAVAPELAAVQTDLDAGAWPQARERLIALRHMGAHEAAVALVLADLAAFDARLETAVHDLERAWQRTGDPRLAARRAELLLAQDRPEDARAVLDEALARSSSADSSDLLLADGDWYRLAGQGDEALARYRTGLARAQGRTQQADALGRLGRALQERGDLAAARDALASAVSLDPRSADLLGAEATAATEAFRLREADAEFDAALALQGDDYESLAGAGFLALRRGQPEAARQLLLKALVIEPRYARAQVWLAVAEYTLGAEGAALDALQRARQADPKDPLPWQIESILRNDSGEPEAAIAAAREALVRLPYLKSLNPLASDSQGSANLGKALGDFGLEHWARAYAQESYYPLWSGSHFFLANRTESSFSRGSEYFQGYLADPLVFGVSEKQATVFPIAGSEWLGNASVERGTQQDKAAVSIGNHGIAATPMPFAWQWWAEGIHMAPRPDSGSYRLSSPGLLIALGARVTDRLSLLLLHNEDWTRYAYPGGRDLGSDVIFDSLARQRSRRTDFGGSWRWSADEQTWLKFDRASLGQSLVLSDPRWGPQDSRIGDTNEGVMLRHTLQKGSYRISGGWETRRSQLGSALGDSLSTSAQDTGTRFDMPWVAFEQKAGAWTWHAQATWPRWSVRWQSRAYDSLTGENLFEPQRDAGGLVRRTLPRLGLSYRFGPGRGLHAAYIESVRPSGAHTLSPVAVGAIPIDYQYQLAGSFVRKSALQLDWEFDARTFGFASLSTQDIRNPTYADGSLLVPPSAAFDLDRVSSLGAQVQSAQTTVDPYNGNPVFDRGRLHQAGVAINRVLAPRWSLLASYTWAQARNTGSTYAGNALPGFARHTAVLASSWKHGGRDVTSAYLVYRASRFVDEANLQPQKAGWDLGVVHSIDSADRRWSLIGTVQTPLDGRVDPTLWLRLRYRMD